MWRTSIYSFSELPEPILIIFGAQKSSLSLLYRNVFFGYNADVDFCQETRHKTRFWSKIRFLKKYKNIRNKPRTLYFIRIEFVWFLIFFVGSDCYWMVEFNWNVCVKQSHAPQLSSRTNTVTTTQLNVNCHQ